MSDKSAEDAAPGDALTGAEMLMFYPQKVRLDLLDNDAFREAIGVEVTSALVIDGATQFDRAAFVECVHELHAGTAGSVLKDDTGAAWTLTLAPNGDGTALWLNNGERRIAMPPLAVLHPDRDMRLAEFAAHLAAAGLPSDGYPEWRAILETRTLDEEEISRFEHLFIATPAAFMRRLPHLLTQRRDIAIEAMVPDKRAYYEHLCGGEIASSVNQLTRKLLPDHVEQLLAWQPFEGAKIALALASHSAIVPAGPLPNLPADTIEALLRWAIDQEEPWSKGGAIELGLAVLDRYAALEPLVITLFEQVRDLDIKDESGPLHQLTGALIITGGELARTRVLGDWPPFQRRLAMFAHAALLVRILRASPPDSAFAEWASQTRARHFYFQASVDQQREPRWHPEAISPDHLKAELLGRIYNAATREGLTIPQGRLHDFLRGNGDDSLAAHLSFPASFSPGPLEGIDTGDLGEITDEFASVLDGVLAQEKLTPASILGLINLRGLFPLGEARLGRAIDVIRQSGHRFATETSSVSREILFMGLAGVAAITRNTDLANELRMMVRKNRIDGEDPPNAQREFLICLTAAAAHVDREGWQSMIGNWSEELAHGLEDRVLAGGFLEDLELACSIAPDLRAALTPAIAAAAGFAGMP